MLRGRSLGLGIFVQDMRTWGKKKKWCPYFLARHMITIANVVVYNYQYMLDPKVRLVRYFYQNI